MFSQFCRGQSATHVTVHLVGQAREQFAAELQKRHAFGDRVRATALAALSKRGLQYWFLEWRAEARSSSSDVPRRGRGA